MKKRGRKLMLVSLLSVALISTNMSFAYASEQSSSESGASSESENSVEASSESGSSQTENAESAKKAETTEKAETAQTTETTEKTETAQTTETTEKTETAQTTETTRKTDAAQTTETTDKMGDTEESSDSVKTSQTEENSESSDSEKEQQSTDSTEVTTEQADEETTETSTEEASEETTEEASEETTEEASEETTEEADEETTEASTEEVSEEITEETEESVFLNKDGEEIVPSSLVGTDYDAIAGSYDGETNVIKKYALSDEYAANTIMDSYIDADGNLIILISQGSGEAVTLGLEAEDGRNSSSGSNSAPSVDGSFSGWDDIPVSYEYNWDNSQNCWNYGVWVDGTQYTTEEGTYDTNVRHAMQLYSDGENVYLRVTFAREFSTGQVANGNDYQFWVDGQMAAYQVEWPDGSQLANSTAEPGTYQVDVRHRDSSWSYVLTDGAVAYYHVNEDNVNNSLELKIPLSEFQKQNGNIDLDNYNMIQFYTPNLMYNRISVAGSSTGAVPFAVAAFLIVPAGYIWFKRKEEGEFAFA